MTRLQLGIEANTAYCEAQQRAADYCVDVLRGYRESMSHIEGFSTLTDENIKAVRGVVFLSKLHLNEQHIR